MHMLKNGVHNNHHRHMINAVPETFLRERSWENLAAPATTFLRVRGGLDGAAGLQQCGRASAEKRGARQSGPRHGYVV